MKRVALLLLMLASATAGAQEPVPQEKPPAAPPPQPSTPPAASAPASPTAGQGRPPIIISALTDSAEVRLQVTLDSGSKPGPADFEAGQLASAQTASLPIVPRIVLKSASSGGDRVWDVELTVSGLVVFGDSTAPLLYRGRQVETLRFHKAGLAVRTPADGTFVARQADGWLLLVLENPSTFDAGAVGARVQFLGADVCDVTSDRPFQGAPASATATPRSGEEPSGTRASEDGESPQPDCLEGDTWSRLLVPRSSLVSLRVPTPAQWFRDPDSGLARSASRRGTLTLRYYGDGSSAVAEQHLPLEVRFEPSRQRLVWSIARVGTWLFVGALISLILRVSIPNYRRKKRLKDQLNNARRDTAEISDQVDSQLRVLLRVERLQLDQIRREGFVMVPDFDEVARRVEAGLSTLTRKIGLVQRLDAAACREEALLAGPVAPTRVDTVEGNLTSACEALKNDKLSEADWIGIQQRLEAADKALNEPSQEEKQAFEALLSRRWQAIREQFKPAGGANELEVPEVLRPLAVAFPDTTLLPKSDDEDGRKWIASVGVVRADLQLTALEMAAEVQFLAPPLRQDDAKHREKWTTAMSELAEWLATPAIANLKRARRRLRQLTEGIDEQDLIKALESANSDKDEERQAQIELDPQFVDPNQTVRATIRFRDPRLNGATARGEIQCEWRFREPHRWARRMATFWTKAIDAPPSSGATAVAGSEPTGQEQCEIGWHVYRYFEPGVARQEIEVRFYYKGTPVADAAGEPVVLRKVVRPGERAHHKKDRLERWLWRPLPQALQLFAALLVPLAALAVTTAGEASSGQWWDLVGIGFGSETIRNILTGPQSPASGGERQ
jgi:hypothetical protein